jgi:hypothetical protein
LLANIYLDALDRELERRGLAFSRYADDCNIYVGSERSAERVLKSITEWIQENLRLEVNATKSGTGRPWERKFLGFRINPKGKIEVAPTSVERFKAKVREMWRSGQSRTARATRRMAAIRPRLVGILPTSGGPPKHFPARGMDPSTHSELLLATVAQLAGTPEATVRLGAEIPPPEGGPQLERSVDDRPESRDAEGAEQYGTAALWLPGCHQILLTIKKRLRSTAVCGKPHVRWCGRVPGRNPRHPTRSYCQV